MQYSILIFLFLLADIVSGYLLPTLHGKYNVTWTNGPLIDYKRDARALMLSVFQPTTCASTVPVDYMPKATAEYQGPFIQKRFDFPVDVSPLLLDAQVSVCPVEGPDDCSLPDDEPPILFLSPGWSFPRGFYTVFASAIASQGFIVMTMDHPNETNIITYPDGHSVTTVTAEPESLDDIVPYLQPRLDDVQFLLDQLENATAMGELLPHRGPRAFSTDRVAMIGQSLGGVAAVYAANQDFRIRTAINWDQELFGPGLMKNMSTPVLHMFRPESAKPDWMDAWPQIQGPTLWLEIANTTHQSFTDAIFLGQASGEDSSALLELVGTIEPERMLRIVADYTAEWMNGVFAGNLSGGLFDGQEQKVYPEVKTVSRSGF
jgi:dienelactone hydrolase